MPFSAYKTIDSVVKEFQITYTKSNFIIETELNIPDYFREDLEIVMQDGCTRLFGICDLRKPDLSSFKRSLEAISPKIYTVESQILNL